MARTFLLILLATASLAAGCTGPELSTVPGVSIKRYMNFFDEKSIGQAGRADGSFEIFHETFRDLVGRTLRNQRVVFLTEIDGRYNVVLKRNDNELLQKALKKSFGVSVRTEKRAINCRALVLNEEKKLNLKPSPGMPQILPKYSKSYYYPSPIYGLLRDPFAVDLGTITFTHCSLDDLAHYVESWNYHINSERQMQSDEFEVVLNETGIKGQFDFVFDLEHGGLDLGLQRLGLRIIKVRREVEAVYVTRTGK
jgi:hypothetical protein